MTKLSESSRFVMTQDGEKRVLKVLRLTLLSDVII